MDDTGRYQCLAENEMGAVEKVVVLLLQSESRLPCQALGGDSVKWARRGSCAEAVAGVAQAV